MSDVSDQSSVRPGDLGMGMASPTDADGVFFRSPSPSGHHVAGRVIMEEDFEEIILRSVGEMNDGKAKVHCVPTEHKVFRQNIGNMPDWRNTEDQEKAG